MIWNEDFEWNIQKSRQNMNKHGVSFEEASSVFDNPLAITYPDEEHELGERRFILVGTSERGRILLVWYTERDGRIRIIGARRASAAERRRYSDERN